MDAKTRARFEAAGWTVGSTQSFLGLSFEDMALLQDGASQAEAAARMPALQKLLTSPSCFPDPDPAESIRDIVSLVETWRMNPHLGDPFGDSE